MAEPTDEDLVRRVRAGDRAAEEALFQRHRPQLRAQARRTLRGILRRRVGDSDVVQDAYLAAFRSLDEFEDRGEGSFVRWLQRILQHKAQDQVRRHVGTAKRGGKSEVSQAGQRLEAAVRSALASPSLAVVAREDSAEVRSAMATLPEDYRNVLDCVHRAGMTLEDVGRATGRSANAVCKVYGRAVRALSKALGERRRA